MQLSAVFEWTGSMFSWNLAFFEQESCYPQKEFPGKLKHLKVFFPAAATKQPLSFFVNSVVFILFYQAKEGTWPLEIEQVHSLFVTSLSAHISDLQQNSSEITELFWNWNITGQDAEESKIYI